MVSRTVQLGIAVPMGAGASATVPTGGGILGFLCTVGGTLNIAGMVSALTVVAGTYYPIPAECPSGATVALTTAAGTLFIA